MRNENLATRAYKPLVYICSPFAGNVAENTEKARRYSKFAVEKGCIPLAPHLLFPQFMDDDVPEERKLAMFMGTVLLGKCEQIWVFGEKITSGMAMELEKAVQWHRKIRFFTEDMREVNKS